MAVGTRLAYRLNGNEVYMYSNTGVTGVNAGLVITHVISYYYRNASLVRSDRGDSTAYGRHRDRDHNPISVLEWPVLPGDPTTRESQRLSEQPLGTSPVCGITNDNDPYVDHYYDSSKHSMSRSKPTIQVTGDPTGATRWAFWYLGWCSVH